MTADLQRLQATMERTRTRLVAPVEVMGVVALDCPLCGERLGALTSQLGGMQAYSDSGPVLNSRTGRIEGPMQRVFHPCCCVDIKWDPGADG